MAWDFPLEEAEAHCCLWEASLDHWFRRFRWAAGLHSLVADGGNGEGIELGLGLGGGFESEEEEEQAGVGESTVSIAAVSTENDDPVCQRVLFLCYKSFYIKLEWKTSVPRVICPILYSCKFT